MDPLRVEAYLRSLCSVLDFDIGELWCARKIPGDMIDANWNDISQNCLY